MFLELWPPRNEIFVNEKGDNIIGQVLRINSTMLVSKLVTFIDTSVIIIGDCNLTKYFFILVVTLYYNKEKDTSFFGL